eukprot:3815560-Amphidinium_carterae.2
MNMGVLTSAVCRHLRKRLGHSPHTCRLCLVLPGHHTPMWNQAYEQIRCGRSLDNHGRSEIASSGAPCFKA